MIWNTMPDHLALRYEDKWLIQRGSYYYTSVTPLVTMRGFEPSVVLPDYSANEKIPNASFVCPMSHRTRVSYDVYQKSKTWSPTMCRWARCVTKQCFALRVLSRVRTSRSMKVMDYGSCTALRNVSFFLILRDVHKELPCVHLNADKWMKWVIVQYLNRGTVVMSHQNKYSVKHSRFNTWSQKHMGDSVIIMWI